MNAMDEYLVWAVGKIHSLRVSKRKKEDPEYYRIVRQRELVQERRRANNPARKASYAKKAIKRRQKHSKAAVAWADKKAITAIYAARDALPTPSEWHVDHIIPLTGKDAQGNHVVCGLHVHNNLKIVPAKQNMAKGARFDPEDHQWTLPQTSSEE